MNQIRLFIFCSSVMLTVWLAASYTAQLDGSTSRKGQGITLHNQTGEPLAVEKTQEIEGPTAARTAVNHILSEGPEGSDTPPIAHIK